MVRDDESVQVVGDDLCLIWLSAMNFLATLNMGWLTTWFSTYCWLSLLACNIQQKICHGLTLFSRKGKSKGKNYFVIQLVELVQIFFTFFSGGTKCKLATYLWFWHTIKIHPNTSKGFLHFSPNYYIAWMLRKIPQYMVLLNLVQCHQPLSPLKLILQWMYVNANPFTKMQSSLHNIEK